MRAVLLVARSEARRRRAALLGLALVVALVGTAVLGAAAGARRSASAIDRLGDATAARDGRAFAFVLGADVGQDLVDEVSALDGVEEVGGALVLATDASFDIDSTILAPLDDVQYQQVDRPLVLDGRLPDPDAADEIVVSELAVDHLGLHTGDRLRVNTFSDEDCAALANDDFLGFNATVPELTVVGEVRVLEELQGSDVESGPQLIATPAFTATLADEVCSVGVLANARYEEGGGPSDAEMTAATRRAAPVAGEVGAGSIEAEFLTAVHAAVDVVVTALLAFALVTGVAGLLALTQAVARQVAAADRVEATLGEIGLTRSQRAVAVTLPLVGAAIVGAVVASVGAAAMSPLFPLGVARQAEPEPGIRWDPLVVSVGVPALVIVVAVVAFFVARRNAARPTAEDGVAVVPASAARSGASPTVVVGLRLLADRTGGRSAVRTAAVGVGVALAGVCAVAVMSSSLATVLDEPDRYGWPWTARPDLDSADPEATVAAVTEEDGVEAVGVMDHVSVDVGGEGLEGFALSVVKGSIEFPVLEGRAPAAPTEIALGAGALTDVDLGETVALATPDDAGRELEVVGRVILPHIDSAGGSSALVVPELIPELGVDVEKELVLTYADGVDAGGLETRLEEEHGLSFPTYARANPPGRLLHLDAIGSLLVALAAFFALLGLVGLLHAVATSARRHRGHFATLRSLGFVRRQVVRSVVVSGVAIVVGGAVVGVPLGIVAGRFAWLATVNDIGIVDTPSVPLSAIAVVVVAAVVAAAAVAALPAWQASRRHPAELLRAE